MHSTFCWSYLFPSSFSHPWLDMNGWSCLNSRARDLDCSDGSSSTHGANKSRKPILMDDGLVSREQTLVNKTACVMIPMLSGPLSSKPWQRSDHCHERGKTMKERKALQQDITLTTQDMAESRINFPAISSWFQTRAILKTLFKQRSVPFRSLSPFQTKSKYVWGKIWYVCNHDLATVIVCSPPPLCFCVSIVGIDLGTTYVIFLPFSIFFDTQLTFAYHCFQ